MSAAKYDITIEQGALFERLLTINDENGSPLNLTGYVFEGDICLSVATKTKPIATFEFEITDAAAGKVRMFISAEVSRAFKLADKTEGTRVNAIYLYDVKYGPTGGERFRLLQGKCEVSPEVTT